MTAESIVDAFEDPTDYEAFEADSKGDYQPRTTMKWTSRDVAASDRQLLSCIHWMTPVYRRGLYDSNKAIGNLSWFERGRSQTYFDR